MTVDPCTSDVDGGWSGATLVTSRLQWFGGSCGVSVPPLEGRRGSPTRKEGCRGPRHPVAPVPTVSRAGTATQNIPYWFKCRLL